MRVLLFGECLDCGPTIWQSSKIEVIRDDGKKLVKVGLECCSCHSKTVTISSLTLRRLLGRELKGKKPAPKKP